MSTGTPQRKRRSSRKQPVRWTPARIRDATDLSAHQAPIPPPAENGRGIRRNFPVARKLMTMVPFGCRPHRSALGAHRDRLAAGFGFDAALGANQWPSRHASAAGGHDSAPGLPRAQNANLQPASSKRCERVLQPRRTAGRMPWGVLSHIDTAQASPTLQLDPANGDDATAGAQQQMPSAAVSWT
jgi:hypothetical protein